MKNFLFILVLIFITGCGYERVYIDIEVPFVVGRIIHTDDHVRIISKTHNLELNFASNAQIILPHDYGYRIGDTLRIVDMRSVNLLDD